VTETASAGVYLENLTWPEAEKLLARGPTVLIPLGARCKEHGLHLPLNNDWRMAEYLARRVVAACPVVAVPTVQYGYYPAFAEYPGSITVGLETSRDLLVDICRSLAPFGPRRFYVLNTGVSTVHALRPARERLMAEGLSFEFTDLRSVAREAIARVRQQEAGTHADEIETSMMLYIAPETVRPGLAVRDIHEDKGPGNLTRKADATVGVYSPTGAWGDPTLATREKGELIVEAIVSELIAFLRRYEAC
jgi:creatinine amidohydrolase